jgi:hypothetical protein
MQDIAGTRITVPTPEIREATAELVLAMFSDRDGELAKDTRADGNKFGYRAMHVVVRLDGRWVEIQIRTLTQDAWANLIETLDRAHGWDLKHGDGPTDWLEWAIAVSAVARQNELNPAVTLALPPSPYDRVESGEDLT